MIINHFRSERPWVAALVDRLDPLTRQLGWRTTLRFDDIRLDPLQVERRYKTSGRSLFTIVQARKGAVPGPVHGQRHKREKCG